MASTTVAPESPHRTLNNVLKAVAIGLAGAAAGGAAKRPGEAAAAGLQTGIGLAQQAKQNERAQAESEAKVRFQNVQSAEATARAAMYDKQLHQMDTTFQDEHNSRTLQQMKDFQAMGISPTIVADNHGTGANAALEQLTQSHGGVPHMFILNLGDKLVGYDMKQLGSAAGMRDQVNAIAKIQGKGDEAYPANVWGSMQPETRNALLQQSLGFFNPMPTKENIDNQLQQYKNYRQTYAQNPSADKGMLDKLDGTIKLLEGSRDTFIKQGADEAGAKAKAVQDATLPGEIRKVSAEAFARKAADRAADQKDVDFAASELIKPDNLTALSAIASMRGDERLRIYAAAKKLDSTFDPGVIDNKRKFLEEFTNPNGKTSQGIDSANTFMQHGADLLDLTGKYRTSDIKLLNTPLNKINDAFGSAKYSQYKAGLDVVRSEYTNAVKAGFAPQEADSKEGRDILSETSTPAQVEAAVKQMSHTISRRMDSTNEKFRTVMGQNYPNLVTPAAAQAAGKLGLDLSKYTSGGQVGRPTTGAPAGAAGGASAASNLPPLAAGFTRIKASDGTPHDVPTANLAGAKKIDPNLQVMESK